MTTKKNENQDGTTEDYVDPEIDFLRRFQRVQLELGVFDKDADNDYFSSNYTQLPTILKRLLPLCGAHDLLLIGEVRWMNMADGEGFHEVRTIVRDLRSNHQRASSLKLVGKQTSQGIGSDITYARRYTAATLFCMIMEDEDDDGEAAMGRGKSAKQEKAGGTANLIANLRGEKNDS